MTNRDHTAPAANEGAEPIRTLVVDDAPQWLRTVCAFLASEPAIVIVGTARDGRETLGRVETLRPELVVLDVQMPRMNGLQAAALIRTRFPGVRILMMSSNDDSTTRSACLAHGAHAFVGKGETAETLLPAISRLFAPGRKLNADDARHGRIPVSLKPNTQNRTMMDIPPTSQTIASEKIAIERKIFFLDLKENARGRFLKITEDVGGRRDTIMLPREGFREFVEALARLVEFESKL